MAITKDGGRQWPLVAKLSFGYADHGASGVPDDAIDVPAGASVRGSSITITTAYDSATSDSADVAGAGITLAGVDMQALGTTEASAIDSTAMAVLTPVTLEWTEVGGSLSAGAGFLTVEYIVDDKANEVQPV